MLPCPQEYPEFNLTVAVTDSAMGKTERQQGDVYFNRFKSPLEPQNPLNQALNEYTKAAELNDDPAIQVQMARTVMLNGKLEAARQLIEKVMAKQSLDKDTRKKAMEVQAYLAYRLGNYPQAKQLFKQAFRLETPLKRSKLYFGFLGVQLELNREKPSFVGWLSAMRHFAMGLLLHPFSEPMVGYKASLALLKTSVSNRFRSQEQTLAALIKLYNMYPGMEILPLEIGKIYHAQERFSEAEFWFSRTIYRHPTSDEGYRCLANLYRSINNAEGLADTLKRWLEIRPNSGEILLVLSQTVAQSNDAENLEQAVQYTKQALLLLKEPAMLANAYTHLGNLYAALQMLDCAILAFQSAISIYPTSLDSYVQLGTLYYDKQEFDLSQKIFEKALALSPNNAKILCNLGYLAWMQGNINQAMAYYHNSVELEPTYDIALNNLGVLYLDHIGNIDQAMSLFDQTLAHSPDYALCHYNKGRAYSFLGKTIEAARCFRQAQELNENTQELDNSELTERIKQLFEHSEQPHTTDS